MLIAKNEENCMKTIQSQKNHTKIRSI